jgi:hypothetical protein
MRKILSALVVAAAALTGVGISAGSASANTAMNDDLIGGTTTLTVDDVRYGASGACTYAPVSISIDVPDDYAYAEFEYTSTYDGPTTLRDYVDGSGEWSGTYSHTFMVCPEYDSPGTYQGMVDVTFYDFDGYVITTTTAVDAFRVSAYVAPVTHSASLSTSKVRAGAHGWAIKNTVRHNGHAWASHKVTLQRKYSGAWHNVKAGWTNSSGQVNLGVTPTAGAAKPYRTVSAAGSDVGVRVSPTYWLKRR